MLRRLVARFRLLFGGVGMKRPWPETTPFPFRPGKAIQAAAFLLRCDGVEAMNYMRLLKLLYLADRRCLEETGHPITGDWAAMMERGPVLSNMYDLIKGEGPNVVLWERFFRTEHYNIRKIASPSRGQLSAAEIDILRAVADEHREHGEWDLSRITHALPECKKNEPEAPVKQCPIPFDDTIEALGLGGEADEIKADARSHAHAIRLFRQARKQRLATEQRNAP